MFLRTKTFFVDVVLCTLWMQFYVRRYMYIVDVVICTLQMQFYVHCQCSFMYIVDVSIKKVLCFFAKVNINLDTAFQGNNGWEKCWVEGKGVWGVWGNLKEVRRATISVNVSNSFISTLITFLQQFYRVSTLIFCRPQNPCQR